MVELDCSSLTQALKGLTRGNLQRDARVRRALVAAGMEAKQKVLSAVRAAVPRDPNQAYKGVRLGVMTRQLGAFIAILDDKSANDTSGTTPPRKGTRGIRMRSARTKQLQAYHGRSRAFVLRFLNTGTVGRTAHGRMQTRGGKSNRRAISAKKGSSWYRGRIKKGNFFMPAAEPAIRMAADRFMGYLNNIVNEKFDKS